MDRIQSVNPHQNWAKNRGQNKALPKQITYSSFWVYFTFLKYTV